VAGAVGVPWFYSVARLGWPAPAGSSVRISIGALLFGPFQSCRRVAGFSCAGVLVGARAMLVLFRTEEDEDETAPRRAVRRPPVCVRAEGGDSRSCLSLSVGLPFQFGWPVPGGKGKKAAATCRGAPPHRTALPPAACCTFCCSTCSTFFFCC
jgi:hypothetical protein